MAYPEFSPESEYEMADNKLMADVEFSQKVMGDIRTYYDLGEEGKDWYANTYPGFLQIFKGDVPRANLYIGFLAATSQNAETKANVTLSIKALKQYDAYKPFVGYLDDVIANLNRVIRGEQVEGPKVGPFQRALMGDTDAVVIDLWMMRAFGFPEGAGVTPRRNRSITNVIRAFADEYAVEARQFQAAVWAGVRGWTTEWTSDPASFEELYRRKMGMTANPDIPMDEFLELVADRLHDADIPLTAEEKRRLKEGPNVEVY